MKKFISVLLALVLVFAMSSVAMAAATTYEVDTEAELRTALAQVGAAADDKIIIKGDITLTQDINKEDINQTNPGLWVTCFVEDGVTIDGAGHTITLYNIFNGHSKAVFEGGNYTVKNLILSVEENPDNLNIGISMGTGTVTNCTISGKLLGAVASHGTTITDCHFQSNGWGIYAERGKEASHVSGCTFDSPRAVALYGTEEFVGNTVNGDKGVSLATTNATVTGNTFTGDRALSVNPGADGAVIENNNFTGDSAIEIYPNTSIELPNNYWGKDGFDENRIRPQNPDTSSAVVEDTLNYPVDETGAEIRPAVKRYAVEVADTENGDVTVKGSASYDSGVVITAAPHYGYEVGTVTVTKADGTKVDLTERADGTYSFSMPRGEVTIKVTFVPQGEAVKMVLTIGSKAVDVNGKAVASDVAPVIKASRTFLPVRLIAENLGAKVEWNNDAQTVTITKGDTVIVLTVGSTTVLVNGQPAELEAPVFIENSRTYLPVRFIAEKLGADVEWDGVLNTVTITGRK